MSTLFDTKILDSIANFSTKLLKRNLTSSEYYGIRNFVTENINYIMEPYGLLNEIEIISILSTHYVNYLEADMGPYDTTVIPTQDTIINEFLGTKDLISFISHVNPAANKKKAYITLDTRYAEFLENNTKLRWTVQHNITDRQNATDLLVELKNITKIQLCSFVMQPGKDLGISEIIHINRMSILIDELSEQSFVMPNGRKFHFIGKVNEYNLSSKVNFINQELDINNEEKFIREYSRASKNEIQLDYNFNHGIYNFEKPITKLDTITLSIANPFDLLKIPEYIYHNAQISISIAKHSFLPFYTGADLNPINITLDKYHNIPTDLNYEDSVIISTINGVEAYVVQYASIFIDDVYTEDNELKTDVFFNEFKNYLMSTEFNLCSLKLNENTILLPNRYLPSGTYYIYNEYQDGTDAGVHLPNIPVYNGTLPTDNLTYDDFPDSLSKNARMQTALEYYNTKRCFGTIRINTQRIIFNLEVEYEG